MLLHRVTRDTERCRRKYGDCACAALARSDRLQLGASTARSCRGRSTRASVSRRFVDPADSPRLDGRRRDHENPHGPCKLLTSRHDAADPAVVAERDAAACVSQRQRLCGGKAPLSRSTSSASCAWLGSCVSGLRSSSTTAGVSLPRSVPISVARPPRRA